MDRELENFTKSIALVLFIFYYRLNAIYEVFKDRSNFIYLARAGITIKRHLELFRKSFGKKDINTGEILWINRNIVTNSIIDNDTYFKILKNKFNTNNDILSMLQSSFNLKIIKQPTIISDDNIKDIIFKSKIYRERTNSYLKNFFLNYQSKNFFMVDSGWNGTTEDFIDSHVLNDLDHYLNLTRLNFGVLKQSSNIPAIGIMFHFSETYNENPLKNFSFCRHLIEVLLEPEIKSPNNIFLKDKTILPDNYDKNKLNILNKKNKFAIKVEKLLITYFKNNLQYKNINFKELHDNLSSFLRYPNIEISKTASKMYISHDDGRKGNISIIGDKKNIIYDLWPQANYSYFYHQDYSIGYLNSINKNFSDKIKNISKKLPFVDVITRTMDRPFFLERALKSVQNQNYLNVKHIIVIDGSDPIPIINKINETIDDPFNIKLVCLSENYGMESASNCAIENSSSELILIHDDDDTLEKSFLTKATNFLIENKDLYKGVITYSNEVKEIIDRDNIKIMEIKPYNNYLNNVFIHDILQENNFPPISFLFFRDSIHEIGLFDERLPVLGDWDFNIRFLEKFEIGLIKENLANYHIRDITKNTIFGNSVNTGINKHQKYQQIVRNEFYRRNPSYAMTSFSKFQMEKNIRQTKFLLNEFSNQNTTNNNNLMEAYYKMMALDILENFMDENNLNNIKNMDLNDLKKIIKVFLDGKNLKVKSRFFNEKSYLEIHKDVNNAINKNNNIKNGLYHYLIWGFFEGRKLS